MRDGFKVVAVGFGSGLMGAVVAVAVMGAARQPGQRVESRQFILKAADGRTAAALFETDGAPTLHLYDARGDAMFSAGVGEDGAGVVAVGGRKGGGYFMAFAKPDGAVRASVQVKGGSVEIGGGGEGPPGIMVADPDAKVLFKAPAGR
jgi:L-ascorbate metabolism protein UlaG (beta-lactamase superfamily)